jgi:hypothetical protein
VTDERSPQTPAEGEATPTQPSLKSPPARLLRVNLGGSGAGNGEQLAVLQPLFSSNARMRLPRL